MFGGPCPSFSFGDTDAFGAWPALLGAGGGVFQTVHRPGSPEAPAALLAVSGWLSFGCWLLRQDPRLPAGRPLWVLAPPPPGPGAGWALAVLSEASGSTGRFGVTMQPGQ